MEGDFVAIEDESVNTLNWENHKIVVYGIEVVFGR